MNLDAPPPRSGGEGGPDPPRPTTAAQLHPEARTCYDHLAGSLGVAVCDALVARDWLDPADGGWTVTARGVEAFGELGRPLIRATAAGRP